VIDERLSIGMVILRIITTEESEEQITSSLAQENSGATSLDAQGSRGSVKMVVSLVHRADVPRITEFIRTVNSRAFFSIEDVRYVNEGVFRPKDPGVLTGMFSSDLHKKKGDSLITTPKINSCGPMDEPQSAIRFHSPLRYIPEGVLPLGRS
jgi:hypothetical protein